MVAPVRGSIWWSDLNPTTGHEQAGRRPVLVISASTFNSGPRGLIIVVPLTRTNRPYPFHIELHPADSGLDDIGYIMCEQVRSISISRFLDRQAVGQVPEEIMSKVEFTVRSILDFDD